jgi:L-aminopeptidase/D-esterase-like protein
VRFLSNQLTAAVQRESAVQAHQDGSGEEVSEGTASSGDGADAAEEGDGAGEAVSLVTGGLRDEIRAMEAYVFGLVGSNLAKRKLVIHSAIAEDGRVDATMDGQSAAEAGPWKVRKSVQSCLCDECFMDWPISSIVCVCFVVVLYTIFVSPVPSHPALVLDTPQIPSFLNCRRIE